MVPLSPPHVPPLGIATSGQKPLIQVLGNSLQGWPLTPQIARSGEEVFWFLLVLRSLLFFLSLKTRKQ